MLGTWLSDDQSEHIFLRYIAVSFARYRTWELQVPTEKPKRLGKWQGLATGGDMMSTLKVRHILHLHIASTPN